MATSLGNLVLRTMRSSTVLAAAVPGASATAGHSGGTKLWRNLSFFVAFPAVAVCMLNAYLKHQEESHHERPEFIPYEHLRIRNKRFPWGEGNKTLFHNPHTNPLPDGYETGH
ncbi:cytochrome c oxidase subunit 6A, mitochondrial isoform X2 [Anabrus simplex]|uniref:cytochrome c oxidase subunit 6A, mitochondrial isoform X2 n=1 Tax=Anabrus simplex TaxID=316456 RepID=UPI0035A37482